MRKNVFGGNMFIIVGHDVGHLKAYKCFVWFFCGFSSSRKRRGTTFVGLLFVAVVVSSSIYGFLVTLLTTSFFHL